MEKAVCPSETIFQSGILITTQVKLAWWLMFLTNLVSVLSRGNSHLRRGFGLVKSLQFHIPEA